jgi:hypothetical protein
MYTWHVIQRVSSSANLSDKVFFNFCEIYKTQRFSPKSKHINRSQEGFIKFFKFSNHNRCILL